MAALSHQSRQACSFLSACRCTEAHWLPGGSYSVTREEFEESGSAMSQGTLTRTVPECRPWNQPWPPSGLAASLSMTAWAADPSTGGAAPLSHFSLLSQLLIEPSWIPTVMLVAACALVAAPSGPAVAVAVTRPAVMARAAIKAVGRAFIVAGSRLRGVGRLPGEGKPPTRWRSTFHVREQRKGHLITCVGEAT